MQHVPISGAGGPSAVTSVMAGDTPVITTVPVGIVPFAKSGKLVALAVTGDQRLSQLPDVPTFKELGIDMEVPGWYSVVTRSGAPADAIDRLNKEINKALETPQVADMLDKAGSTNLKGSTPETTDAFWKNELKTWVPAVQALNISLD